MHRATRPRPRHPAVRRQPAIKSLPADKFARPRLQGRYRRRPYLVCARGTRGAPAEHNRTAARAGTTAPAPSKAPNTDVIITRSNDHLTPVRTVRNDGRHRPHVPKTSDRPPRDFENRPKHADFMHIFENVRIARRKRWGSTREHARTRQVKGEERGRTDGGGRERASWAWMG